MNGVIADFVWGKQSVILADLRDEVTRLLGAQSDAAIVAALNAAGFVQNGMFEPMASALFVRPGGAL